MTSDFPVTEARPSILITDDDPHFRETLSGVLAPCGFRTLLAGDGEEALHIVYTRQVHLLVVDMHMPKLTGLETMRRVKQVNAVIPCILMSARLDEGLVEEARQANAFSVLPKPISRLEIMRVVRGAMRTAYGWH
jgi:CheY-like chemotaxis protein